MGALRRSTFATREVDDDDDVSVDFSIHLIEKKDNRYTLSSYKKNGLFFLTKPSRIFEFTKLYACNKTPQRHSTKVFKNNYRFVLQKRTRGCGEVHERDGGG